MALANTKSAPTSGQSGAALLVFLLLIVVSASTLLLNKLNTAIKRSVYNPESALHLEEARVALMSWAVNHPENPGTLPMPDRNGDGDYDGNSDCIPPVIVTLANNHLLGKIPWRGSTSPCVTPLTGLGINVFDSTGEQLWYAVSKNLVYEHPDYPFISPGLLYKTTDWITVRDSGGNIVSDRVAFVVIAPGPVLSPYANCGGLSYSGQDRSATAPAAANYLDIVSIGGTIYSNADTDQEFIMYPNSVITNGDSTLEQCDQFNDQLVFVTIDELMEAVSKRVLNETANALTAWHNANDALPWLTPFADPKAEQKSLRGTATSTSDDLTDTSTNFNEWGVTPGDTVWNLTDGSRTTVATVDTNTLTLNNLRFGTNNTFADGNEYFVDVRYMPDILMQTATAGSDGNTLVDSGRDFAVLGVAPGDIIENLYDGSDRSSGVVSIVDGDEITVTGLTGGTVNEFASGDNYRIRTNTSEVTNNTANLTLIDTNADFIAMGVQTGDIVHNLWDSATGRVTTVDSSTQLAVDKLALGTGVVFNYGEPYRISRYKGRDNTRVGLLPIHQMGEIFPSGFTIDWNLAGGTIATTLASDSTYTTALTNYVGSSGSTSGSITVPETDAACQWLSGDFVHCKGIYDDSTAVFLSGTATTGSTSLALRDSTKNFTTLGAKRGDKVRNITDGTTGIVFNRSSTQLTLVNISGMSNVDVDVGESFQIDLATSSITFDSVSPSSSYSTRVYYPGSVNESLLAVGDTIENTEGSTSIGIIESINTGSNYIVHSVLMGGGYADIYAGETVRIKHNFVSRREYQFDVTLKGTSAESSTAGIRTRTVCRGYDSSCTTASNNATFKGDASTAWVTIRDYEGGTQVGQATNTISTDGVAFRSLRIGGLSYSMDEAAGDLPEWFVRNKWNQYVMIAYSNGDAPGETTCIAGTDCLSLNLRNVDSSIAGSSNNVRALVMLSRHELAGQSWATATAADYFDDADNTNLDNDIFEKHPGSDTYNDLIRIAVSCPSPDEGKLCWSN